MKLPYTSFIEAITSRSTILYEALTKLSKLGTSPFLLATLEEKLNDLLQLQSKNKYITTKIDANLRVEELHKATRHQNIIGWDNLLCGFTSKYGHHANLHLTKSTTAQAVRKQPWTVGFVDIMLDINKFLWAE
jgi:hypothetical protein